MRLIRASACFGLVTIAGCTSFGESASPPEADAGTLPDGASGAEAGDAATCAPESCAKDEPSCRSYDFEGSGCPAEWQFTGDSTGVVGECKNGKVHVAASDTLDVTGELYVTTPGVLSAIHVSARIAVKDWDGGAVLGVRVGGNGLAQLQAVVAASGNVELSLCGPSADCASEVFVAKPGEEHLFALEISSSATVLSVDCRQVAKKPATVALSPKADLLVSFGKTDGSPIDGTLDDLVISFR